MSGISSTSILISIAVGILTLSAGYWLYSQANSTDPLNEFTDTQSPLIGEARSSPSATPMPSPASPTASPSTAPPEPISSQIQERFDIAQSFVELSLIRSRLANTKDFASAYSDIQKVRGELERGFADANSSAQDRWQQIDAQINQAEELARSQSLQALDHIDTALELLRQEVSP